MQNVFFNDEVLIAEKKIYSSLKIPSLVLMENAGANSANYVVNNYPDLLNREILIITGKGNNAGDGFVAARHLSNRNIPVKVLTLYKEKDLKGDSLVNYTILKNQKNNPVSIIFCHDVRDLKKEINYDNKIIIDAIFGVGFKGEMESRIDSIAKFINKLKDKIVISEDVPSGLFEYDRKSNSIKADVTLTMGVKKFHSLFYKGREDSGKIEVMNIGISDSEFTEQNVKRIFEIEENDVRKIIPERKINSNKYSNGKVFILAGSPGLTGAAYLCSMSALKAGSGAVVIGIPESDNAIMEVKLTEVMTMPLKETEEKTLSLKCYGEIRQRLRWADTVLIGPGLSKNEETMELVRKIVKENDLNFILDADAISAFKGNLELLKEKKIVLTPHYGEFANLTGVKVNEVKDNFYELTRNFAKDHKVILVLKNSPTIITDGDSFYINSTGRENLATAGTGDVLSGIITGINSQTKDLLSSVIAGVYIHGRCGDKIFCRSGANSTIASELINEIQVVKNEMKYFEN